ncbi:MAG: hypothetical protein H6622_00215 [Halobacteriovoraceae bacterium]|nr:hypothetical protein [Halobacteriovoraceae bacterium]
MKQKQHENKIHSRDFLKSRGYCCKSGCENCPYDDFEKGNPNVPFEFIQQNDHSNYICEQYEEIEKELFKMEGDL